ncbi:MAG: TrbI/VirB10 family protein [Elusimicrobiota bacterium]
MTGLKALEHIFTSLKPQMRASFYRRKSGICVISLFCLFVTLPGHALQAWPGLTSQKKSEFKNFLHTGFTFDAVIKTAIFSFNIETPVIALVEYDITFNDKIVLPKGTKLIGAASIIKSDDRVNVIFQIAVFPDGSEIPFIALALDKEGAAGVPGKKKNTKAAIPARVILEAAGAGASAASPVTGAAIKELSSAAREDLEKSAQYSISVKKDAPVLIYVVQRIEY